MNTLNIQAKDIHNFAKDLKRVGARHYPFQRSPNGYIVTLYPNPNLSLLQLKYCIDKRND